MLVTYTSKAKEDLIRIDWKMRHRIIDILGKVEAGERRLDFARMHNSEYYKVNFPNHLLIGSVESGEFNVITVMEKKRIKFPD
jgi:hypothetical protein